MEATKFHSLCSAYDPKKFDIEKGNSKSYIPFFEFVFEHIINSYKGNLQQFVGERTERKLGYVK